MPRQQFAVVCDCGLKTNSCQSNFSHRVVRASHGVYPVRVGNLQANVSPNRLRAFESFLGQLQSAPAAVLALDYDGTLAPFHPDRHQALPYPGVQPLLARIQAGTRTRLIFVSGRPAQEVRQLLSLTPAPEVWGAHGLQRLWPDGRLETLALHPAEEQTLHEALAALQSQKTAATIEQKPGSVAAHWRGLPDAEIRSIQQAVRAAWLPLAARLGPPLLEFDGGMELRSPQQNKGRALRTILGELPPQTPVAYLGDDTTDEDAFLALRGHSPALTVLVRPEWRTTHAQAWIRPPEELLGFLEAWLAHSRP